MPYMCGDTAVKEVKVIVGSTYSFCCPGCDRVITLDRKYYEQNTKRSIQCKVCSEVFRINKQRGEVV